MARSTREERKALAAFLSRKRAQLVPSEFGLPDAPRRTAGLRREEVAALAGVSISWYTWIEQGRDVNASAATLRRIASVLRLDDVETAHLLALTSHGPPAAGLVAVDDPGAVSDGLRTLVEALDPIPAYVRNSRFDILAWNRAVTELFLDYAALAPHERNTIRLLFLYPPYRESIVNWQAIADVYVASLRAARARAADKHPFDRLVAELEPASVEFARRWSQADVTAFDEGRKIVRHPTGGEIEYTYLSLSTEKRRDLSLVTYLRRASAGDGRSGDTGS